MHMHRVFLPRQTKAMEIKRFCDVRTYTSATPFHIIVSPTVCLCT